MFALLQKDFGEVEMGGRRRDEAQRIAGGGGFGDGRLKAFDAMLGGDFLGGLGERHRKRR